MNLNSIILISGIVLFVLGFLLRGNAKKNNVIGVISMVLMTAGAIALIYCAAQWIGGNFSLWQEYSKKF